MLEVDASVEELLVAERGGQCCQMREADASVEELLVEERGNQCCQMREVDATVEELPVGQPPCRAFQEAGLHTCNTRC